MVKRTTLLIITPILVLIANLTAFGQTNRYMVFFTDKDTSLFNTVDPLSYLSQRSLDRRQKQAIPLTIKDFVVRPAYLDSVEVYGMEVFASSRWLNACLASGTIDQVEVLQQAPYVDHIEYVAPQNVPENARKSFAGGRKKFNVRQQNDEINFYQNNLLGVDEMHADGFQGEGMLVAVVDGGFKGVDIVAPFTSLREDGRIVQVYNFVNFSDNVYNYTDHGTRALSCMAAEVEGQYTGTCPKASFMLLVSEDVTSEYRIEEYNWILAAEMADSAGADIISTSLGYNFFDDPTMDYALTDLDGQTAVISQGSDMASETGMLLVSSAGNEGDVARWQKVVPPADAASVLAVGAFFGETMNRASFSSTGPTIDGRIKPDLMAAGAPAWTINQNGQPIQAYGTSFAAPTLSGLAAGFWQANPTLTAEQVRERLIRSGSSYLSPDSLAGHGSPDYTRAQENILLSDNLDLPLRDIIPYPYPNPLSGGKLYIPLEGFADSNLSGNLISNDGRTVIRFNVENTSGEAEKEVELGNLPAGVYLLTLAGESLTRKYRIVKY